MCRCAQWKAYDDKMWSKIRKTSNSEVIELQVRKRNMWSKGLSLPLRASRRQSH